MFLLPVAVFAQGQVGVQGQSAGGLLVRIQILVNQATTVLVAVAILVFIFGIVRYVIADNEEQKSKAQSLILYGVIGLFAIVSVWGLVNFLANTTGIGPGAGAHSLPCPPGVPTGSTPPGALGPCI